jgi:hypothetical protein
MVHLQFVKSVVNCGLCCLKVLSQLLVVSFEDGSFVRFFPDNSGLSSLVLSRIKPVEVCGE